MQEKLSDLEIRNLERAKAAIIALNWMIMSEGHSYWSKIHQSICDKIWNRTSDGKPLVEVEPELTDKDACVWPRMLVMVRDSNEGPWAGPYRYLGRHIKYSYPFIVESIDGGISYCWKQARPATAEEIKEAGL